MERNNAQKSAARRIQRATGATYPQALRFAAYEETKVRLGTAGDRSPAAVIVGQGNPWPVLVTGAAGTGKTWMLRGIASELVAAGWRYVVDIRRPNLAELKGTTLVDAGTAATYLEARIAERQDLSDRHGAQLDELQGWLIAEPIILLVDADAAGIELIERRIHILRSLGIHVIVAVQACGPANAKLPHFVTTDVKLSTDGDLRHGAITMSEGFGGWSGTFSARDWDQSLLTR